MNYRKYELLPALDITTPTTKTLDLKGLDPISRIIIQTSQTQSATEAFSEHPAKIIQKIEVVDGSTPIFSASGIATQAQDFYRQHGLIQNQWYDKDSHISRCNFRINFGRFLFDPVLGFDPGRFKNPQLKITHDKTAGGTATPTAQTLRVELDTWDEKMPSLTGMLQFTEIFSKLLVVDVNEPINLPLDQTIKSIMLQALIVGCNPADTFKEVKLDENQGKRIVFHDSLYDMLPNLPTFLPYEEMLYLYSGAGIVANRFCTSSFMNQIAGMTSGSNNLTYLTLNDGGRVQLGGAVNKKFYALARGYCPHGAVSFPFGDPKDIADWYQVTHLDKLTLNTLCGGWLGTAGTQQVLVESLRSY